MSDIPPWTRATTKNTMEWRVKIGKTFHHDGSIMVGVAVKGTSLNDGAYVPYKDGVFLLNLYESLLYSGAPFNYKGVKYGQRKEAGRTRQTETLWGSLLTWIVGTSRSL